MSYINNAILQLKNASTILTITYLLLLGLLISVAIISAQFDISVDLFTRDPAALFYASPFIGIISNIGILFWCSASAICFFTAVYHYKNGCKITAKFLMFSGLLTTLLLFDDFFMFHEVVFPDFLHIPEKLVYVMYLTLILMYFIKFRIALLQTDYILLFLACSFLGLSMLCDMVLPQEGIEFLIEDGFKLFGILTWLIFYTRTCFASIQNCS